MTNSEVTQEIRKGLGIQPGVEKYPNVVPVLEVNSKLVKDLKVKSVNLNNSLTTTLLSANPNQDIYILGFNLSITKDATATNTYVAIGCTQDGAPRSIIRVPLVPLVADSAIGTQMFTHPFKIDRNTAVNCTSDTNVANFTAFATIFYYVDETSNG